jgi:quaternary ammonium compound-resistance protein SugE
MKFSDLKTLRFINFYRWAGGLPVLLPFIGYILFGLANIYLFSLAIKALPTATAFAVWTATFYDADYGGNTWIENLCRTG